MEKNSKTPRSGAMQWNAGGWFGTQLGSTCWIAICGGLLVGHNTTVAGLALALFVGANAIGLLIWLNRARFSVYSGMQALIIVIGITSLLSVAVIDQSGLWRVVEGVGGTVSAQKMYVLISVMVVALLWLFWAINRSR